MPVTVEEHKAQLAERLVTVWLAQAQMAEPFQRDQSVVARHLRNVFREHELDEKSTMQRTHIASSDRPVAFYSLDAIEAKGREAAEALSQLRALEKTSTPR
jgi:hypothetical protein